MSALNCVRFAFVLRCRSPVAPIESTVSQRELLVAAAPCVKPGGVLVYSTCSVEADENQEQVEWFLEAMPGFELDSSGNVNLPSQVIRVDQHMQCLPFLHGTDGAFAARLRRRED